MSIHEHLPPQARRELKEVDWTKGKELAKLARAEGQRFDCAPLGAQSPLDARGRVHAGGGKGTDRAGDRAARNHLLQALQEPDSGNRAGRSRRPL
jgi:hypothetical protein